MMSRKQNPWAKLAFGVCIVLVASEMTGQVEPLSDLRLVPEAQARIGRPLTPVSYAGVARRTTRRVVRRSAIYVSTLPVGCPSVYVDNSPYWYCGGSYYQRSGNQYVIVNID